MVFRNQYNVQADVRGTVDPSLRADLDSLENILERIETSTDQLSVGNVRSVVNAINRLGRVLSTLDLQSAEQAEQTLGQIARVLQRFDADSVALPRQVANGLNAIARALRNYNREEGDTAEQVLRSVSIGFRALEATDTRRVARDLRDTARGIRSLSRTDFNAPGLPALGRSVTALNSDAESLQDTFRTLERSVDETFDADATDLRNSLGSVGRAVGTVTNEADDFRNRVMSLSDTESIRELENDIERFERRMSDTAGTVIDLRQEISRIEQEGGDVRAVTQEVNRLEDALQRASRQARDTRGEIGAIDAGGFNIPAAGAPGAAAQDGGVLGFLGQLPGLATVVGAARGGRTGLILAGLGLAGGAGAAAIGAVESSRERRLDLGEEALQYGLTVQAFESLQRAIEQEIPELREREAATLFGELARESAREILLRGRDQQRDRLQGLREQGFPISPELEAQVLGIPTAAAGVTDADERIVREGLAFLRTIQTAQAEGLQGPALQAFIDEIATGTDVERLAGLARQGRIPGLVDAVQRALDSGLQVRTEEQEAQLREGDRARARLSDTIDRGVDTIAAQAARVEAAVVPEAPEPTTERVERIEGGERVERIERIEGAERIQDRERVIERFDTPVDRTDEVVEAIDRLGESMAGAAQVDVRIDTSDAPGITEDDIDTRVRRVNSNAVQDSLAGRR